MHVKTWMNGEGGWTLAFADQTSMTYNRTQAPKADAVIIMLLLGILPGLLYLLFGWSKETRNIYLKARKQKVVITVEAGRSTAIAGKNLVTYFSRIDPTVPPPPPPPKEPPDPIVLVLIGGGVLALIILVLTLALLPGR